VPDSGEGNDEEDIWPVKPSEAAADVLADPALLVEMFSTIVGLTVAIAQDPWLAGSREAEPGSMWRTLPIPRGGGIVEYVIIEDEHRAILTRIVPF
jgi:hypothetical protein